MWRFIIAAVAITAYASGQNLGPKYGNDLVSKVLDNCIEIQCVKKNVLEYLDNILNIQSDSRNAKNIDVDIYKRVSKIFRTHEFRYKLPEMLVDQAELIYNPTTGVDIKSLGTKEESRGLGLKKKLLFPILLLFKLKMKLLMPLFVALIGLKATKALILSKLAIVIVLGFIIYQLLGKSGMPMALSMAPAAVEPPVSMYGVPVPSTSPPSSYEPGWEPNQGGPYQRVWTSSNSDPQSVAYSAYYPGMSVTTSSTSRP